MKSNTKFSPSVPLATFQELSGRTELVATTLEKHRPRTFLGAESSRLTLQVGPHSPNQVQAQGRGGGIRWLITLSSHLLQKQEGVKARKKGGAVKVRLERSKVLKSKERIWL